MKTLTVKHAKCSRDFIRHPELFKLFNEHKLIEPREKEIERVNAHVAFSNLLMLRLGENNYPKVERR